MPPDRPPSALLAFVAGLHRHAARYRATGMCLPSTTRCCHCRKTARTTYLAVLLLAACAALCLWPKMSSLRFLREPPQGDQGSTPLLPAGSYVRLFSTVRTTLRYVGDGGIAERDLASAGIRIPDGQVDTLDVVTDALPGLLRPSASFVTVRRSVVENVLQLNYGPGNVSAAQISGVPILIQRFPIHDSRHIPPKCMTGAAPSGVVSSAFINRIKNVITDRMNERSVLEPTFRFVSVMTPIEPAAVVATGSLPVEGFASRDQNVVDFPHVCGKDVGRMCGSLDYVALEALPKGGCPNEPASAFPQPFPGAPWCTPWHAPVFIGELACGFVESFTTDPDVSMSVIAASGALMSHNQMKTRLPSDIRVKEFDTLAVPGWTVYGYGAGHFFNEVLPRLVHLDANLPGSVPLLWPSGRIPAHALAMLRTLGVLRKDREVIELADEPSLLRARKLYFFGSTEPLAVAPVVTWLAMRYLAVRLQHALEDAGALALPSGSQITVLKREPGGARSLANHGELMAALRDAFPGADVTEWHPSPDNIMDTAALIHRSRIIIGVHGANLNNLLFARPADLSAPSAASTVQLPPTALIEIGFLDRNFNQPTDYLCLARNLGVPYWLTLPVSGSYADVMVADVPQVVEVARQALFATGDGSIPSAANLR